MNYSLTKENKSKEMRQVYGEALEDLFETDEKVVALDADLASSAGTGDLFAKYEHRTINAGISEQNMIGSAAGMSLTGLIPYVHTFCPFSTRRVLDQIYMSLAYSKNTTHIYGSDPGLWAQYNGGTHTSFEDLSVLRAIPNITITAPSDPVSMAWILRNYHDNKGVYYTRAPRSAMPYLYTEDSKFEYGKSMIVREGNDVVILALGSMVHEALGAAEKLSDYGIEATVVDVFFIKPFDNELLQEVISKFETIVTVENHNKYGGLSDIVSKGIVESKKVRDLEIIAIEDRFGEVGNPTYLKQVYGLDAESIAARIKNIL